MTRLTSLNWIFSVLVFDAIKFLRKDMVATYEYNPKKVGLVVLLLKKLGLRIRPSLLLTDVDKTKNELDELKSEVKELRQLLISTRETFAQDLLKEIRKEVASLKENKQ